MTQGALQGQRELFLSLKIPRAFIIGESSPPDPDVDDHRSAGITILVVPRAGHGMTHDNPDAVAATLRQVFQS